MCFSPFPVDWQLLNKTGSPVQTLTSLLLLNEFAAQCQHCFVEAMALHLVLSLFRNILIRSRGSQNSHKVVLFSCNVGNRQAGMQCNRSSGHAATPLTSFSLGQSRVHRPTDVEFVLSAFYAPRCSFFSSPTVWLQQTVLVKHQQHHLPRLHQRRQFVQRREINYTAPLYTVTCGVIENQQAPCQRWRDDLRSNYLK